MTDIDVSSCKCGAMPEVYIRYPVAVGKYQGEVVCPDCGAS